MKLRSSLLLFAALSFVCCRPSIFDDIQPKENDSQELTFRATDA